MVYHVELLGQEREEFREVREGQVAYPVLAAREDRALRFSVSHEGGKVPGLTTVMGESTAYDGQAPTQMTLESGGTVFAEFSASNVKRFVLSMAQLEYKCIEAKFSPSGKTLTSPAGRVVKAKRRIAIIPTGGVDRAGRGRRSNSTRAEPFDQDEESRVPEQGEEVCPEELLRAPDVCEAQDEGSSTMRAPMQPSEAEKQEHFAMQHEPYADWREECVAGRGRGMYPAPEDQRRERRDCDPV